MVWITCPVELWDAGGMLAGRDSECCSVKYCCDEWSWHFVSEQPPGSGLLNFSCSPVAPVFPCSAPSPALCSAGRRQKTRSLLSWGALVPAQPFLHPRRDGGASRTCPRRGKQRTWHRVGWLLPVMRRKIPLRFKGTLFVTVRLLSRFCRGPAVS